MSEPYIGEIRIVGFNFAPVDWALCNGQTMAIAENEALFNLIGTTYGGDGQQTFNLPDLQCRIPIHQGSDSLGDQAIIGQLGGVETVTLTLNQLPMHTHPLSAQTAAGNLPNPANAVWAKSALEQFSTAAPATTMAAALQPSVGGDQPHDNMPPYVVLNFVISLFGVYPSQG